MNVATIPTSGYLLMRVVSNKLSFEGLPDSHKFPDQASEPFTFGWDWWVHDEHEYFTVSFSIQVEPIQRRPERLTANLLGTFRILGDQQTVSPLAFAQIHAPSILMPYIRESVSSLSGRGLVGPLYLPPINVAELMAGADFSKTMAFRQMNAKRSIARLYGLPVRALKARARRLGSPKNKAK